MVNCLGGQVVDQFVLSKLLYCFPGN